MMLAAIVLSFFTVFSGTGNKLLPYVVTSKSLYSDPFNRFPFQILTTLVLIYLRTLPPRLVLLQPMTDVSPS